MGVPPMQYLMKARMRKAWQLPCRSNHGIQHVVCLVRFESASYFETPFKRWSGSSPAAYRRIELQKREMTEYVITHLRTDLSMPQFRRSRRRRLLEISAAIVKMGMAQ
jgi:AraC-like DNA-binding protein